MFLTFAVHVVSPQLQPQTQIPVKTNKPEPLRQTSRNSPRQVLPKSSTTVSSNTTHSSPRPGVASGTTVHLPDEPGQLKHSPRPSSSTGVGTESSSGESLLNGTYDESASQQSFHDAVLEWRREGNQKTETTATSSDTNNTVDEKNSLLEGTFDEKASHQAFLDALHEWRGTSKPEPITVPAQPAALQKQPEEKPKERDPDTPSLLDGPAFDENASHQAFVDAVTEWRQFKDSLQKEHGDNQETATYRPPQARKLDSWLQTLKKETNTPTHTYWETLTKQEESTQ